MSVDRIDTTPPGDDVPHIADPGHDAVDQSEPTGGTDHLDTITHVPQHGHSRNPAEQPEWTGVAQNPPDIDAVLTGTTPETGPRDVRDAAVQVAQIIANHWDTYQYFIQGSAVVQLLPRKAERTGCVIKNKGDSDLYIAPTQGKATLVKGFLIRTGESIAIDTQAGVWACIDSSAGSGALVTVAETWRTDNAGN